MKSSFLKLYRLVSEGNLDEIQLLLEKHSSEERRNLLFGQKGKESPLAVCARRGSYQLMKYLLTLAPPLTHDFHKHPLHEAAAQCNVESMRALLDIYPGHVNTLKLGDWTALMVLCAHECRSNEQKSLQRDCFDLLIDRGAYVSLKNKDRWTALHLAIKHGNVDFVDRLLRLERSLISCVTNNARNVFHLLAMAESLDDEQSCKVADRLMALDASLVSITDACGTYPLFDCLRRGKVRLAELYRSKMLKCGDLMDLTDSVGFFAIHVAAEAGKLESVEYLLERAGEGTVGRTTGEPRVASMRRQALTPLHLACREGHAHLIRFFWQSRLPLDSAGRSPIFHAAVGTAGQSDDALRARGLCIQEILDRSRRDSSSPVHLEVRRELDRLVAPDSPCSQAMRTLLLQLNVI